MIKKIIHSADWHLRTLRYHDEYKETFKNFINDCKLLTKEYDRNEVRIVIAGDLVHSKTVISNELLLLLTSILKELEKIAPLVIIAGNHDLNLNNTDRLDTLTPIISFLQNKDITYFKESNCYLDENVVWCVYSIIEDSKRPNIELARKEFGEDKTYIGLFHGPIVGLKTDLGYEIDHGYNLDIFDGCDLVMCGDIHSRSELIYKNTKVVMPSSLIQQDFGENVSRHGFLFWDVNDRSYTEHDVKNDYPFYKVRITSLDDLENNNEKIINL